MAGTEYPEFIVFFTMPEISQIKLRATKIQANIGKVRVVKYIVVYCEIKAADQKYCQNEKWRRKIYKLSKARLWILAV